MPSYYWPQPHTDSELLSLFLHLYAYVPCNLEIYTISILQVNHLVTDAQVVSCHRYPVVFHPFVEQLATHIFYIINYSVQLHNLTQLYCAVSVF